MLQNNIVIYCVFAITIALVIRVIPTKSRAYILLAASCLFYMVCDYRYALLLVAQILISFFIGQEIYQKKRRLILGIIISSSALIFIKVFGFYISISESALSIVLPLGISYYTFKIISYLVDSYKCESMRCDSLLAYANYIAFFPQIVCGPIARAENLMNQIDKWISGEDAKKKELSEAITLILAGLFKKIVIADRLANYVGLIFGDSQSYPALALVMAAFFYSIELYCDFAGYSQIAIGVAQIMGISIEQNFNLPYFAYSIKDFWSRWHISLSSWLKDYIYIPLGGKKRRYINVMITFLVSGLWHGNGVNFIIWGCYHGILNLFQVKEAKSKLVRVGQILCNFVLVTFGWIFFGINNVSLCFAYLARVVKGINHNFLSIENITYSVLPFTNDNTCAAYFLTVMLMIVILFIMEFNEYRGKSPKVNARVFTYVVCIILFGVFGKSSFIYANF